MLSEKTIAKRNLRIAKCCFTCHWGCVDDDTDDDTMECHFTTKDGCPFWCGTKSNRTFVTRRIMVCDKYRPLGVGMLDNECKCDDRIYETTNMGCASSNRAGICLHSAGQGLITASPAPSRTRASRYATKSCGCMVRDFRSRTTSAKR